MFCSTVGRRGGASCATAEVSPRTIEASRPDGRDRLRGRGDVSKGEVGREEICISPSDKLSAEESESNRAMKNRWEVFVRTRLT